MPGLVPILGVLVGIAVASIFAGAETAYLSLSRLDLAQIENKRPGLLRFWERTPDKVLAALLLGNSLIHVALGLGAIRIALELHKAGWLLFLWGSWLLPSIVALVTIVFGEIAPKVLARGRAKEVAVILARPIAFFTAATGPAVGILVATAEFSLAQLSKRFKTTDSEWTAPVVRRLLEGTALPVPLRTILGNILTFARFPVSHMMTPRDEMFVVDATLPTATIIEKILVSGRSRVPVVRGSRDNVAGLIHAKDLLALGRDKTLFVLDDILRPAFSVSPEAPLIDVLRTFRQGHYHLALVRDAAGRVQGLITLQDILESVVGDVREIAGA